MAGKDIRKVDEDLKHLLPATKTTLQRNNYWPI